MGAKVANPDKLVVNVMGDGAVGMTGMDWETASRNDIPILSVIKHDSSPVGAYDFRISKTQKPGHCRIRATCARRGTRQLEFIRFRSADGEQIRALPELPEGGKIYQYINALGEALAGASGPVPLGSPLVS